MDAAFEFSVNGLNMELTIHLVRDGHSIPDGLFVDILTEKCQLLHQHIKSSKDCLMLVANIGRMVATIKLFNKNLMDSQLLHCTISNLGIWRNNYIDYAVDDPSVELKNIDDYYSSTTYEDMMRACLL